MKTIPKLVLQLWKSTDLDRYRILLVLGADQPVNGVVGPSLGLGVEEASCSIWGTSYLGTEEIIKFD